MTSYISVGILSSLARAHLLTGAKEVPLIERGTILSMLAKANGASWFLFITLVNTANFYIAVILSWYF